MTQGNPELSVASVILTEDLKVTMATAFGAKVTAKQRDTEEVRQVSQRVWGEGSNQLVGQG